MSPHDPPVRHGLVIGKFYPPHAGHHHLIRQAAAGAQQVTVVVMAAAQESISLADRVRWLRAEHAAEPGVTVVGIPCDVPVDFTSGPVWAAQVAAMRAAVGRVPGVPVDAVFTSEPYGAELAARLGARHVPVDPSRSRVPVSGTAVRADLAGCWDRLAPATRAGLAVRVVVVGAESTGTTTVSRALAQRFQARGGVWARTRWVPEFGREYTEGKLHAACAEMARGGRPGMADLRWDAHDFAYIAGRQTRMEEAAARSGSPLLVCDTDALATTVWELRYAGPDSRGAEGELAAAPLPRRDVHLITDHIGVPFEQDGWRDGEHVRAEMTGWFCDALTAAGHSWVLLTGTLAERVDLAERVADQLLSWRGRFAAPLG